MSQQDDTGARLRQVRETYKLSQRQLAKRSGVANATISQIEAGHLNPTVGMLKKILQGIPISMAAFFGQDEITDESKYFFTEKDFIDLSEGQVSYRQIGGNIADRAIQLMKETYAPGGDTGRHALHHTGEECGLVLSGRIKITVAGKSRVLKAGEAYYFKSELPHTFKNIGDEPCELISACTPPSF